jgi:peptidoglycan/xylan/chitin deacetylase (PgdA/CDA1 family)
MLAPALYLLLNVLEPSVPVGVPVQRSGSNKPGPITRVVTDVPVVALTFDACATKTQGYGFDRAILEVIRREQVPVTIFVSGRWAEFHPDVMEELANDPLIEFGDHSYDHPHMTLMPADKIAQEIDQAESALAKYGKKSVAFRPPFGEWSRRVMDVVRERQLVTVTWDVVSGDPSGGTTTQGMIRTVVSKTRPGSIVVFHINGRGWKTSEALPSILRALHDRGFRFVPLSELLAAVPSSASAPVAALAPALPPPPAAAPSPPPPPSDLEVTFASPPQRPIITQNPYETPPASASAETPSPHPPSDPPADPPQ